MMLAYYVFGWAHESLCVSAADSLTDVAESLELSPTIPRSSSILPSIAESLFSIAVAVVSPLSRKVSTQCYV